MYMKFTQVLSDMMVTIGIRTVRPPTKSQTRNGSWRFSRGCMHLPGLCFLDKLNAKAAQLASLREVALTLFKLFPSSITYYSVPTFINCSKAFCGWAISRKSPWNDKNRCCLNKIATSPGPRLALKQRGTEEQEAFKAQYFFSKIRNVLRHEFGQTATLSVIYCLLVFSHS